MDNGTPKRGAFIIFYAPNKAGKTLCAGAAAAGGLLLGPPSGLLSLHTFYGIDKLDTRNPKTIRDTISLLRAELSSKAPHRIILVDDWSITVDRAFDGDWNRLGKEVLEMGDVVEELNDKGLSVVFTCHEQAERVSSGKNVRGGPALPGQYPEKFSALSPVVLRAVYDELAAPWPWVLWSRARHKWIAGDRLNVFPDKCPLNIAEGLRASGYTVPRPKGMEWIDALADKLAARLDKLDDLDDWRDVLRPALDKLSGKHDLRHLRWAAQDALHRVLFARFRTGLDSFFAEADDDAVVVVG